MVYEGLGEIDSFVRATAAIAVAEFAECPYASFDELVARAENLNSRY